MISKLVRSKNLRAALFCISISLSGGALTVLSVYPPSALPDEIRKHQQEAARLRAMIEKIKQSDSAEKENSDPPSHKIRLCFQERAKQARPPAMELTACLRNLLTREESLSTSLNDIKAIAPRVAGEFAIASALSLLGYIALHRKKPEQKPPSLP